MGSKKSALVVEIVLAHISCGFSGLYHRPSMLKLRLTGVAALAALSLLPTILFGIAPVASAASPAASGATTKKAPAPLPPERVAFARKAFTDGLQFEQRGDIATAISAYREAVRADSTIPEAHYRMGLLLTQIDRLPDAAKAFRNELLFRPNHVGAARELGLIEVRTGKVLQGLPRLERLVRAQPQDDQAWSALGFAYSIAGKPQDAERALRKAIEYPPERATEHRDLGVALVTLGRTEDARNEYRAAIALDGADASTWVNLGNLEGREGKWQDALEAYRRAEGCDSSYALALQGQAQALDALKQPAEAAATTRRWLHIRPDDHRARLEAVGRYQRIGDNATALAIAREGVQRSPNSGDAHIVLGSVHDAQGNSREALRELRTAVRLFNDPLNRGQAVQMYKATMAAAPESIRALARADSIAEERTAARRSR